MKKYILALTFSIITIGAFAQTIRYGLKAGVNIAKFVTDNNNPGLDKNLIGLNVGAILDIGFAGMSIQPGLLYTTKGQRFRDIYYLVPGNTMGTNNPTYTNMAVHYLELPVNILFDIKIAKPVKMQLGFGPYFAYNTSYKNNSTMSYYSIGRTDAGANVLAGFVLHNKYLLNAQYSYGLTDVTTSSKINNRVASFSVGYFFK